MDAKEKEFTNRLNALFKELLHANAHYGFWEELVSAKNKYSKEMNEARNFWSFTLDAHIEACLAGLMRLTDSHRHALSVQKFLGWIEKNSDLFQEPLVLERLGRSLPEQIAQDRLELDNMGLLRRHLKTWRDKRYAHLDETMVVHARDPNTEHPIYVGEVRSMLATCAAILNHYGYAFNRELQSLDYLGTVSTERAIFEPLRRDRLAQRLKWGLPPETVRP